MNSNNMSQITDDDASRRLIELLNKGETITLTGIDFTLSPSAEGDLDAARKFFLQCWKLDGGAK